MRRIISFAAICAIATSSILPVFGQRMTKDVGGSEGNGLLLERSGRSVLGQARGGSKKSAEKTAFAEVLGHTDGSGVWIRWKMETEIRNMGFTVYRLGKKADVPVPGFIAGSSLKVGDEPLFGSEYHAFDPEGTQDSTYVVEALGDNGRTLRSRSLTPQYTPDVESLPDGKRIKAETFGEKLGDNLVSQDLNVSSDLQTEIQAGLYTQDPDRHREVISTPGAVRIAARADGLIRVTFAELQQGGFDVGSDPLYWQLYMDGAEVPIILDQNAGYIEFLGKGLDTLATDIRTYFLISGEIPGKRIASQTVRRPVATIVSQKYSQTFSREDKKGYTGQILNGEAENWWGDVIVPTGTDYRFNLSGIDRTPGTRRMTIMFQGFSLTSHTVELKLNGLTLPLVTGSGRNPFQKVIDVPVTSLLDGENQMLIRSLGSGDVSLLDRVSIEFPRKYVAMGNKLEFYTEYQKNARVSGFSSPNIRVFDVTHQSAPRIVTNLEIVETNGTWGPIMPAGREQVLYAIEAGVYAGAVSVTPNDPSLLSLPSNTGALVVITHPSLKAEADAWAGYRAAQGTSTRVVDVTDIYDEFGYGVMSSKAIEDFLVYAKNNWQIPPAYVLLLGDGHYDSRNYDSLDPGYWNMIPPRLVDTIYEQSGSDEALADFDNDGLAEIAIGRIPARTPAAVTIAFNRMITWEGLIDANPLSRGVIFAYDRPNGYNFKNMSGRVQANLPADVPKVNVPEAICTDDTNVLTCVANPNGNADIRDAINTGDGKYVINYTGHGSGSFWSRETFFRGADVNALTNASRPILITALTCLNGNFMTDEPVNVSFAESMTSLATGGAVGVWASTGKTTPDVQEIMASRFFNKLGGGTISRLGDLIGDAKAQVPAGADVRLSWALVGDPMLKVRQ